MQDSFQRKIEYVRISLTDRCNLRCRYCMPEEGIIKNSHEQMLTFEELERVIRLLTKLGIKKVRLTGGEPLVRKGIISFISRLKAIPEIETLAITTNGVLLKNMAQDLLQAGISQVNISLDTLREDRFLQLTRRPMLKQVLEGIDAIEAAGCKDIKINCVPISGINEEDIANLAAFAKNRPIKVRYIQLMPVGCACHSDFIGLTKNQVMSFIAREHGELIPIENISSGSVVGPAQYYHIPGFKENIGFIDALNHKFCDRCNRVRITAEGFLKLCLNSKDGADLRTPLRSGASDEEILNILQENINRKPQEHFFDNQDNDMKDCRNMYQVGG